MSHPVELILGRDQHPIRHTGFLEQLRGKKALITGAHGSIGFWLAEELGDAGVKVAATDIDDMDVRVRGEVLLRVGREKPDLIFHLAGDKHAPHGEDDAEEVVETNIHGTINVLAAAGHAKVILASTCKACDPETVYGATKLICERLALQNGHSVARFYNVVETQGNVFQMWDAQAEQGRIYVADCHRYFISLQEAVSLLIATAAMPLGRYTINPGPNHRMLDIARRLYPDVAHVPMQPRRGDRRVEPLLAGNEEWLVQPFSALRQITNRHDLAAAGKAAA